MNHDVVWSRWSEVDRHFAAVLEVPPADREAVLRDACGDDDELRTAVRQLLELTTVPDPISAPGPELLEAVWTVEPAEMSGLGPGHQIGRYRIHREVGRGGMATVYEAERCDGAYSQRVAVKVLHRGLDTDRIVRRFLTERQILSELEHPNIARLLDGGSTADGRPYLVTELVDGQPLMEWADTNGLGMRRRLELFQQITAAVGEAHRRLVVHRDIKPSNILVDRGGRVRLLDFGIAKLLDQEPGDALTDIDTRPLTRRYASPEQRVGGAITVSTDVYQLGLILHLLLTGCHPYRTAELDTPQSAELPHLPSRAWRGLPEAQVEDLASRSGMIGRDLERALRGDLDTIIQKALAPAPEDRYRSVDEFSADIRRHLEGRPIHARPAPWTLRVRKWVSRNRWAPPTAAGLALVTTVWVATVVISAQRLKSERNVAQLQAERAERIKDFLLDLFGSADPFGEGGSQLTPELTVADALVPAAERVRRELADDPVVQADLLAAVASILFSRDREEGMPLVEEALRIRESAGLMNTPEHARDLQVLASFVRNEFPDSARSLLERAIDILRAEVGPDDPRLAQALAGYQWLQISQTGVEDAAAGEEALAIYQNAGAEHAADAAGVLGHLSYVYSALGRMEEAEGAARDALRTMRSARGADHPSTAQAATQLAQVYTTLGRHEEAEPLLRSSAEVMERTAGPDHNQTRSIKHTHALALSGLGRHAEAASRYRELIEAYRNGSGQEPSRSLGDQFQNLATVVKKEGRLAEADSLAREAQHQYNSTTPEGHYLRAFPLLTRTEILLLDGRPAEARETAREALTILEGSLPEGHYATEVARCRLGIAERRTGMALSGQKRVRTAATALRADDRTPEEYLEECEAALAEATRDG